MSLVGPPFCCGVDLVEYELTADVRGSGSPVAPL